MLSFAVSLMKSWGVHRDEYLRLTDFLCLKSQRFVSSPCPIHPKLEVSDEVIYFLDGFSNGEYTIGFSIITWGIAGTLHCRVHYRYVSTIRRVREISFRWSWGVSETRDWFGAAPSGVLVPEFKVCNQLRVKAKLVVGPVRAVPVYEANARSQTQQSG